MKLLRPLFALSIVASVLATTAAQTEIPQPVAPSNPLTALQHDLRTAANLMGPCPPIYEGHCGKSKAAVHEARVIVDGAIAASAPPKEPAAAAKPPAKTESPKKTAQEKPAAPAKPVTKDPAAPLTKEEEAQKIAESQERIHKAIEAIQKAIKDYKATASTFNEAQAAKLEAAIQTAEAEAEKAYALHATAG
jgi:hypothetical protein